MNQAWNSRWVRTEKITLLVLRLIPQPKFEGYWPLKESNMRANWIDNADIAWDFCAFLPNQSARMWELELREIVSEKSQFWINPHACESWNRSKCGKCFPVGKSIRTVRDGTHWELTWINITIMLRETFTPKSEVILHSLNCALDELHNDLRIYMRYFVRHYRCNSCWCAQMKVTGVVSKILSMK